MKAANEMFTKPAPAVKPGDLAVVVGAGVSGVAAAKLLHKLGARVRLLDRSLDRIPADFAEWAESAGVEIVCGEHSPSQFRDAKLVVPSPGVAAAVISKFLPDGTPPEIMAETELAWRQLSGEPVLGVTGTSGKTTTTSLCAAMLKEQGLTVFTGGNIGTPLSEYILSGEKADVVVLELSSFQLQTCSTLHPRVGILLNISDGLVVYPKVVRSRVMAELPFMASENIMMKAVKKGGDRQELHERLRQHAIAAAAQVKQEGLPNDMIARVEADPAFGLTREEIEAELQPEAFTGRAPHQVEEFLANVIQPVLDANQDALGQKAELNV